MKYNDIQLTRTEYNKSASNKQGEFRPPLGFIKEQGWDAANITDAQLDQAFEVYKSSAFDDINAYHIQHPLRRIIYAGLNSDITSGLAKALICQINNALVNGLVEIVNTSSNSTSAFSQTIESTVKINTKGQIDQDTEDALDDLNYRQWEVSITNGQVSVSFGNMEPYVSKTMNGYALESLNFINDNPADLDFPSLEIMKKAIAANNKNKGFLGVWAAPSKADVDNIDAIFQGAGLVLTNGTTLTPATTEPLGTIVIEVPSDDAWLEEEKFYDVTWKPLTFNNDEFEALQRIITALQTLEGKVDTLEDNYAELVAQLRKVITDQNAENARLAALIATNTTGVLAATNVANQALALANTNKGTIDNNIADIAELNVGKFDFNGDGTNIIEIFNADGSLKENIKDLTQLTTQDDIYNAVVAGETGYKIKLGTNYFIVVTDVIKNATVVELNVTGISQDSSVTYKVVARKGNNTVLGASTSQKIVGTPTLDTHATTKKYVDDIKAELLALINAGK